MTQFSFLCSYIKSFVLLLIIVVFIGLKVAEAESANQEVTPETELAAKLEGLIVQLREERADYYAQKSQYETQIQEARENHKLLKDELEELRQQENESDKQVQKYSDEVDSIKKQLVSKTNSAVLKK